MRGGEGLAQIEYHSCDQWPLVRAALAIRNRYAPRSARMDSRSDDVVASTADGS
jgi:hypothetical protein